VPGNNVVADRQANTHSIILGRVEGLEYASGMAANSSPTILYGQNHAIGVIALGANSQPPRSSIDGSHRVGRIQQQIAMGVNALDRSHPIEKYLREAGVFPLYDAGNIGMQMRKLWGVMLDDDFDPRAIADTRPMPFKQSMEGAGLEAPLGIAPRKASKR
jgi:hypothetical protein